MYLSRHVDGQTKCDTKHRAHQHRQRRDAFPTALKDTRARVHTHTHTYNVNCSLCHFVIWPNQNAFKLVKFHIIYIVICPHQYPWPIFVFCFFCCCCHYWWGDSLSQMLFSRFFCHFNTNLCEWWHRHNWTFDSTYLYLYIVSLPHTHRYDKFLPVILINVHNN